MRTATLYVFLCALAASVCLAGGGGRTSAPKVGDAAPLFRLPAAGSGSEIDLGDIVGDKPIVLFFGSYT